MELTCACISKREISPFFADDETGPKINSGDAGPDDADDADEEEEDAASV